MSDVVVSRWQLVPQFPLQGNQPARGLAPLQTVRVLVAVQQLSVRRTRAARGTIRHSLNINALEAMPFHEALEHDGHLRGVAVPVLRLICGTKSRYAETDARAVVCFDNGLALRLRALRPVQGIVCRTVACRPEGHVVVRESFQTRRVRYAETITCNVRITVSCETVQR